MRSHLIAFAALLALAGPTRAQTPLEEGLAGALRACALWVLEPASWADGFEAFHDSVGLGGMMGLVDQVDEATLPPPSMRLANHFWRINATPSAGYILVVSDRLPMCHITGGGDADLQPVAQAVLASAAFKARWEALETAQRGEMISTRYRSTEEPAFVITISRAKQPGGRRDHVQLIATATMELGN